MTLEEVLAEKWAHDFFDDPKLAEEVEDEEFDVDQVESLIRGRQGGPDDWEPV